MTIRRIEDGVLVRSYKSLDLSIANADALIFGGVAKEGGDIKVYRDASGNLQMSLDADAASNTKALDIYGGVVAQNYVTIGQASLNTTKNLYVAGSIHATLSLGVGGTIQSTSTTASLYGKTNADCIIDVVVTAGSAVHTNALRVDGNNIIVAQATGDGAGGVTDKAIGLYGGSPVTQAAAISDPAESIAANNAAIDSILAALRRISLIAT